MLDKASFNSFYRRSLLSFFLEYKSSISFMPSCRIENVIEAARQMKRNHGFPTSTHETNGRAHSQVDYSPDRLSEIVASIEKSCLIIEWRTV